MSFTQAIVDSLAKAAGFTLAGVASIPESGSVEGREEIARFEEWIQSGSAGEMEYLKRRNEQGELLRSSVRAAFPWAKSVIVCVTNYDSPHPRSIDPAPQSSGWVARYAWSGSRASSEPNTEDDQALRPSDYHKILLKRLEVLDDSLKQTLGTFESRCYVDTGPLVERVYARYAGLGWTGKNTCILNQQLGSWLFLGVILTSLELSDGQQVLPAADRCGSCTRCIDACPTQALTPYRMDASRCISYLTIEKRGVIPEEFREGIGRQIFGCDICQDVCPWNGKSRNRKSRNEDSLPVIDSQLSPREALVNPALGWLAEMDAAEFGRWFFGSPVKRAKFEGFRRNLAIAMGNSGLETFRGTLETWSRSEDTVLAEAASWALAELHRHGRKQTASLP